jgi:hypothetical protein
MIREQSELAASETTSQRDRNAEMRLEDYEPGQGEDEEMLHVAEEGSTELRDDFL